MTTTCREKFKLLNKIFTAIIKYNLYSGFPLWIKVEIYFATQTRYFDPKEFRNIIFDP